jgi:large subunit ribosomal protein L18
MKFHSFASSSRCRRRAHRAREGDASASRAPSWVENPTRRETSREGGARRGDEETRTDDKACVSREIAAVVTMAKMTPKEAKRQQRHRKIRAKVSGTAARPRVSVYRSNQHVYVQVIDDENQSTIAALGTMSKSVKAVIGEEEWKGKTVESAEQVGKMLGQMCVDKGITRAVFDRGGFLYHGRVKAVADGARAAGVTM